MEGEVELPGLGARHDNQDDYNSHDSTDTANAARKRRVQRYRDIFALPRFVREEDGSYRRLKPGEYDPNSELFGLCMPMSALSDFGIGVGMYFTTLKWMGILMFFCGIIQLPSAIYFSSPDYERKESSSDHTWRLIGSASCVSEERVCLDILCSRYAGEFHYPDQSIFRFSPTYHIQLKNGATRTFGSSTTIRVLRRIAWV